MEITEQPQSRPAGDRTQTNPAAADQGAKNDGLLNSDFETFLKMLTVQLQNQDPLNPMKSTEFATQLATFSTVEQQVRTNDLLTALGAQMGALSVSQLSGWVGMNARAEMPVNFTGSPVTITTNGASLADEAFLVVHDAHGNEVQRQQIGAARQVTQWAGVSETGSPLPDGTYTLTVESFAQGEKLATDPVYVHARIIEARNENGTPTLVMDTGQEVESADVVGLRAAT